MSLLITISQAPFHRSFDEQIARDMAKGTCRLSLVENLCDTGFYKATEECVIKEDTLEEVESAHNQVAGAIASATKYAAQLPLVKDLTGLLSF